LKNQSNKKGSPQAGKGVGWGIFTKKAGGELIISGVPQRIAAIKDQIVFITGGALI
jgi:hypothetical protein